MNTSTFNRTLAAVALALGLLAAVAGTRPSPTDLSVDAIMLAEWIRARGAVVVLDLRDELAFDTFHVPSARRPSRALDSLAWMPGDTLVLVDGGDGSAAVAAAGLQSAPATVRWLSGGVAAWSHDVLNPTIAEDAPDSAFARFGRIAEISRYFGGFPRVLPAGTTDSSRGDIGRTIRRGCGF